MKVREIMTANVLSVRDDSEVEDAARMLARHRITGLPVVNAAGGVVGLVSELDLITKIGRTVADVMTRGVISISADAEVEQLTDLLASRRIRRVPVMDGDKLVGVVSRSDLVKQIAMRWVCHVCGESIRSPRIPQRCPSCGADEGAFSHLVEMPGM